MVFGKGVNDANYRVSKIDSKGKQVLCPYYSKWKNMLQRCYSLKYKSRQPTYEGCKVCEEWLTFSNFKFWMEKQNWEGKHLDKDLIGGGSIYCPKSCIFLDVKVNNFLIDRRNHRGFYPLGVSWDKERSCFQAHCSNPNGKYEHLGRYDTPESAHLAWASEKFKHCLTLSGEIENKFISEALINKYSEVLKRAERCLRNSIKLK